MTPQAPRYSRLSTSAIVPATPTGNVSTVEDLATAIQNATGAVAAAAAAAAVTQTPSAAVASTGSTAAAAAGAIAANAANANLLTELQSYLSGLQTADGQVPAAAAAAALASATASAAAARNIDLAAALSADAVSQLADDGARAATLEPHLPTIETTDSTKQQLKDTVASPQFRQALSTFSTALQSGQLGPVVTQFKMDGEAVAAANSGDLEQFVRALDKKKPAAAAGAAAGKKDQQPMDEDKPNDA